MNLKQAAIGASLLAISVTAHAGSIPYNPMGTMDPGMASWEARQAQVRRELQRMEEERQRQQQAAPQPAPQAAPPMEAYAADESDAGDWVEEEEDELIEDESEEYGEEAEEVEEE